jgi:TetR/AcrR family transcriptional regulator
MNDKLTITPERVILDAAMKTISQEKISGTRMRQIAANANMSQGNLHYYFPSKSELFNALLVEMLRNYVEERQQTIADEQLEPMEQLSYFFYQIKPLLLKENPDKIVIFDFWVQGTKDLKVQELYKKMYITWRQDIDSVVRRGVEQKVFSPQYAAVIPNLMVSLMEGVALQYLIDHESVELDAYLSASIKMIEKLLKESD